MLKIVKQNEVLTKDTIVALIYAYPGMGKTSISQTANDTLLLDFDGGIERAVTRQDVVKIDSWNDINELISEGIISKGGYKTVVIDTVGTALDDYLANYVIGQDPKNQKRGGGLSLAGYGAIKDVFKIFFDQIKSMKVDLVMIAHLTEKQEGDESVLRPKITGGTYDILVAKCDQMGYMYMANKKRVIEFRPNDRAVGKDAGGIGLVEIPHYTSAEYEGFFNREVLQKSKDSIKDRNQKALEYTEWMTEKKALIDEFKDKDSVNSMVEMLVSEEEMPKGIVMQVKKHLHDKAVSLELEFVDNEYKNKD